MATKHTIKLILHREEVDETKAKEMEEQLKNVVDKIKGAHPILCDKNTKLWIERALSQDKDCKP